MDVYKQVMDRIGAPMKVTNHTKAVLANRRAERKARKELTIADLMDEIKALRKEVSALKATVDGDHRAAMSASLRRHYEQDAGIWRGFG